MDMARQPCSAISIHPPCGGRDRLWEFRQTCHKINFNPPALWGAGRHAFKIPVIISNNFNPPALWGAGLVPSSLLSPISVISIHPPCGGRDVAVCMVTHAAATISIHPPCGGRDVIGLSVGIPMDTFQSTRPVGGGTLLLREPYPGVADFNPPALWGAGQQNCTINPDFNRALCTSKPTIISFLSQFLAREACWPGRFSGFPAE